MTGGLKPLKLAQIIGPIINRRFCHRLMDFGFGGVGHSLRGQAFIQRGTVERALGRDREAARDLERGGANLGGDVGRKALLRAAEIYKRRLGLEADARRCLDQADRLGDGGPGERTMIAGYTIQFGAFNEKSNADSRARRIDPSVRAAGLGPVLVNRQDGFYKVQVGCYRDIMSAERMMARIKMPAGVLATITEIGS